MKIVLITDLYPVSEDEKFTPRTLFDFVKSWQKLGNDVCVVRPNFILNSFVRKKPFYKSGVYGTILNLNFFLPFVGRIKKPGCIKDADIVIAHMPSGILFADKLNIPFIAGIHQSDIDVLTKPLYKLYFKKRLSDALKNSVAIACRSEHLKDKLLTLYPEFKNKTFVASSGIDEKIIIKREINFSNLVKIFTAANFKKRKNIYKLIRGIGGDKNFFLKIAGSGECEKELKKLAQNFDNIEFVGYLKHEDILKIMRESDVFILPSENETLGLVYLESMASGCITVGTKNTGIDGIIKNGQNGFLIEPTVTEIKRVLNLIKNMDDNSLKSLGENSFRTIEKFTKTECAENYLQQILKFLNENDT